jgi:hypothetical protein
MVHCRREPGAASRRSDPDQNVLPPHPLEQLRPREPARARGVVGAGDVVALRKSRIDSAGAIPNGIVSRYPILEAGEWDDPQVSNRGFAWARLDVPGAIDLWAVSLHLLTSSVGDREAEATALVAYVQQKVPAGDYLVIGGDFNTGTRTEACLTTLAAIVDTGAPYPVDQAGNSNTSANRSKPLDWVLADPDLRALQIPVVIGLQSFPDGLVFDSRVYTPLADVAPVQQGDSGATNMQHMAVVKDFLLPP